MTDLLPDMADYKGMLIKLSRRAQSRLRTAGVEADFDDIMQEAQITFMRAAELYDNTRQVKFSTYLWSAISMNLNRYCDNQRSAVHKTGSLFEPIGEDGELIDVLEDPNAMDPADVLEREETARRTLEEFSDLTRRVLEQLIAPSNALVEEIERMKAFSARCKEAGYASPNVKLSVDTICQVMGMSEAQLKATRREVRGFMNSNG